MDAIDTLFDLAITTAHGSPNRVRKVGALLLAQGQSEPISAFNTYPEGVLDTPERHEGNGRLIWMEHAERNAIYAAARRGIATEGARLVATFFPCTDCARAIVQAGIRDVVTLPPALDDPVWGVSFVTSQAILQEGGVRLHFVQRDPLAVHTATLGQLSG